ncbi:hypothetical protein [Aestuariibaculum marinum]|uniref:Pectinesterase catalytic domain-containing protein n=1 Tax=Aestuariibaculum marinum TaxID=2683592 RepID=A0A8J6U3U4_9FLAO|nr:hypothetical protein [Aestuariibaculum marinum]MBD0823750.1 hypothetical protein [Aestuariibaculum marinum]
MYRYLILFLTFLGLSFSSSAQSYKGDLYQDLEFYGDYILYKGKEIKLGSNAFFIDGQMSDAEVAKYPFVFNSIVEASKHLNDGTESSPMVLYIAPWVYWVDDPDDPEIRIPKPGNPVPFGLEISCEWLRFQGLSENPEHIIIASNRGQTMGAKGNFTMLNIKGDGTSAENITFGNYCNLDLVYPLNPKLNRKKRGSAIVQAQLIFSNGDKVVARNTRFISRLNLGPFWGSKRTLFDGCHFEMTDDALNGSAVYLNCSFDFYSSKPFYRTDGTGSVFLNCDINTFTQNTQYFCKSRGPIALVDTRFSAKELNYIGWRDIPDKEARYYQYNVSLNDKPLFVGEKDAYATVEMTDKPILNAYRFQYNSHIVYNTYNLLRGNDDWDPMKVKYMVNKEEEKSGKDYSNIPTLLEVKPTQKTLETGKDSLVLTPKLFRFGNFEVDSKDIQWTVSSEYKSYVQLIVKEDQTCLVVPTNQEDETKEVIVKASTSSGLEAAAVLYIKPSFINPPDFIVAPKIQNIKPGKLSLHYKLDMNFEDESLISWYRCVDEKGNQPIEISVSRLNNPLRTYDLSVGDIGYYIMASIQPKHLRCYPGKARTVIFKNKIKPSDVKNNQQVLIPNFETMSAKYQPQVIPGFWSLDSYAPADTNEYNWQADNSKDPWYYGEGINGAAGTKGFVQNTKGARMRYQPVGESFGDMKISFTAVPSKTAGQGFSSARAQYMDIGIKMDVKNMNGYALRLIRTTKYSDATDFILMKYESGVAQAISQPISASCYRPNCKITIEIKGNKLTAHAENTKDYFASHKDNTVVNEVNLQAEIKPNTYGGLSFQHTGSVGSGATLIKNLKIEWYD